MAITVRSVVSTNAQAFGAPVPLPVFASNPATGDLIVVAVTCYQMGGGTINLPTDTAGNTYVRLGTTQFVGAAGYGLAMFYAKNITGGAAFRVSVSVSSNYHLAACAWAVSGADASPYNSDWVALATPVGSNPTLPTVVLPAPTGPAFTLAALAVAGTQVPTDGSGWNQTGVNGVTAGMVTAARQATFVAHMDLFTEYKVSSAIEAASWTLTAVDTVAMQASFAPVGATRVVSPYMTEVLADAPLLYYRLNDAFAPSRVLDSGPSGLHGSYLGSTGPLVKQASLPRLDDGLGVQFTDGGSTLNYIALPTSALVGTAAVTVELWVKEATASTTTIGIERSLDGTVSQRVWVLLRNGTDWLWRVHSNVGAKQLTIPAVVGTWQHLVGVCDGTTVTLYINGVSVGTPQVLSGTMRTGAAVCTIGAPAAGGAALTHDGGVDELAIFGVALSPARIAAHTAAGGLSTGSAVRGVPWHMTLGGNDREDFDMGSFNRWTPVTPSNTADLAVASDALWIGGAGDLAVVQGNGVATTLAAVPAGSWLPLQARRINATNTTATNIVALNTA